MKKKDRTVKEAMEYYLAKVKAGKPSTDNHPINNIYKYLYYLGDGNIEKGFRVSESEWRRENFNDLEMSIFKTMILPNQGYLLEGLILSETNIERIKSILPRYVEEKHKFIDAVGTESKEENKIPKQTKRKEKEIREVNSLNIYEWEKAQKMGVTPRAWQLYKKQLGLSKPRKSEIKAK